MLTCYFEDGGEGHLRHVGVDTLVIKDGKILLVKRTKKLLEGGKWALVGGFMDRDETIKQTVTREVKEETGSEIKDLQLLTIVDKPDRLGEDRQNVAFVFFCKAVKKDGTADWESDDQQWFSLDDLPSRDQMAFDHYDDIDLYKQYLEEKFPIPVLH